MCVPCFAGLSREGILHSGFSKQVRHRVPNFCSVPCNHQLIASLQNEKLKEFSKDSANGVVGLVFFLLGTLPPADLEPEEAFQASVSGRLEDVGS